MTAGAKATPPSPDAVPGLTALPGPVTSPGPRPPIPHWPERMVALPGGDPVFVAETAAGVRDDEKDPVLCVHGMAGAATNWTDFMAELAPEFACAAVDLPGSGQSPPKGPNGYSIRALANTVIGLIEVRGDGPVHLVGNSMGGAVSVKVAALRPDLVRTLTLISPALPDRLPHPSLLRFPMLATPWLGGWMLRRADNVPAEARVRIMLSTVYYDWRTSVHPDRIAAEVDQTRRRDKLPYSDDVLIGAARAIAVEYLRPATRSLWRDAERIRVPVLAIYGSHDRLVNPRMAARAARTFRDVRVLVLPRTGHVAMLEHPVEVAARFREMVEPAPGTHVRETHARRETARGMPGTDVGFTPITNF
ncbi:MAG TPA: alpha/beta hydrolase [Trebonia sp.]